MQTKGCDDAADYIGTLLRCYVTAHQAGATHNQADSKVKTAHLLQVASSFNFDQWLPACILWIVALNDRPIEIPSHAFA